MSRMKAYIILEDIFYKVNWYIYSNLVDLLYLQSVKSSKLLAAIQ